MWRTRSLPAKVSEMKIGCLGMATLDTLLFTKHPAFVDEAVTPVEKSVSTPGGKGVVIAAAAQLSGAEAVPFALAGAESDLGRCLKQGFDTRYLIPVLDADSRTWITISGGEEVATFVARGLLAEDGLGRALDAINEFVGELDLLYATIEHPAVLRAALSAASYRDLPLALNPSLPLLNLLREEDPALLADLFAYSSYVLCNEREAIRALEDLGAEGWVGVYAPKLREVVITAGGAGGNLGLPPFDHWEHFAATPAAHPLCVVGAGDTFNGAYLAARLIERASPRESCRRGADLAACKVSHRGSMLPLDRSASIS